jgi:hypothetical protein
MHQVVKNQAMLSPAGRAGIMQAHLRNLFIVTIALALGLVPSDAQTQEVSRIVGTFVLNREKSTFGPNGGAQSAVRTYEDRGDGLVHATFEGVSATGEPTFTQYAAKHDGKEYPQLVRGATGASTIALTPVDAYSSNWVIRLDGVVTARGTSSISRDGQTYTQVARGAAAGAVETIQVFDRRR